MTTVENLLVVAAEEANELGQAISKVLRFGPKGHHPDKPNETNEYRMLKEYIHVKAMMEMLENHAIFDRLSPEEEHQIQVAKREAVWEHIRISEKIGTVKEY